MEDLEPKASGNFRAVGPPMRWDTAPATVTATFRDWAREKALKNRPWKYLSPSQMVDQARCHTKPTGLVGDVGAAYIGQDVWLLPPVWTQKGIEKFQKSFKGMKLKPKAGDRVSSRFLEMHPDIRSDALPRGWFREEEKVEGPHDTVLPSEEDKSISRLLLAKKIEGDRKSLASQVTRMKAILKSLETDEPFDYFIERIGIPLPQRKGTVSDETCSLQIGAMNRLFWEQFKDYGSWSHLDKNGTLHEQAFKIMQSLKAFALWTVQPYMDEPAHGRALKPGKGWRTPNLWTGFSSQCWNKDRRTTWEELLEFQTRTSSYALYPGTHFAQVFEDVTVAKLEGCHWDVQRTFWRLRSEDFVYGMLAAQVETVYISVNKREMGGDFGLEKSVLWLYEVPALAENYGKMSPMLQKPWLPAIVVLEMTQSCQEKGLAVAKRFESQLRNKKQPLVLQCRQCNTLRDCLDKPVPTFSFQNAEMVSNSSPKQPDIEDVQNFTEDEKINRLDLEVESATARDEDPAEVLETVKEIDESMKREKEAEDKRKITESDWNSKCGFKDLKDG